MGDLDAAENKALVAANAISEQVGHLWMEAHTEGIRNGMELAAAWCGSFAEQAATNDDLDEGVRQIMVIAFETARDQIRLCALQIPDPDEPATDGDPE